MQRARDPARRDRQINENASDAREIQAEIESNIAPRMFTVLGFLFIVELRG